jgi:DMSO/TMAO reductase YedYZ molybdopterin-dependent catalytic subunit
MSEKQSRFLAFIIAFGCILSAGCTSPQYEEWDLAIIQDDKTITYSMTDLVAMEKVSGYGCSVSTVGIVTGPYRYTGVPLMSLISLNAEQLLYIYGEDQYMWVMDQDQISGDDLFVFDDEFNARDPTVLGLTVILAYMEENVPLAQENGGPLRLVVVSDHDDIITEGSGWVKWVTKIEVV